MICDLSFWDGECALTKTIVDLAGEITGHFKVLFLVFTNGNQLGVIKQDIGGHQGGVGKEGVVGAQPFSDLVLVGVGPLEQPHRTHCRENPRQFVDFGHIGLAENGGLGWVEPASKQVDGKVLDVAAQRFCITHTGHRMIVSDEVKRLALVLQLDGWQHGAKVVANVKFAAGLNAGKNTHGFFLRGKSEESTLYLQASHSPCLREAYMIGTITFRKTSRR